MNNATQIAVIPATKGVISTVTKTTAVCATAAVGAGLWLYEKTITNPLRILYFVGPVWKNAPPDEICHSITGVPAAWWAESGDHASACAELLDRKFHSFDASVMVTVYFTVLTFVVLQLVCTCCCIKPLAREIKRAVS